MNSSSKQIRPESKAGRLRKPTTSHRSRKTGQRTPLSQISPSADNRGLGDRLVLSALLIIFVIVAFIVILRIKAREPKLSRAPIPETLVLSPPSAWSRLYEVGNQVYVQIEAEAATLREPPFEIERDDECSGEQCLVIREAAGSGWIKEDLGARSMAVLPFSVPKAGEYLLWARVRWESGCSNAFTVHLDNDAVKPANRPGWVQQGGASTLGKDTTFESWHWICRHVFNLPAGNHTLTLRNQDDGSRVDQFLFTTDTGFVPSGAEPRSTSLSPENWSAPKQSWKWLDDSGVRKLTNAAAPLSWRGTTEEGAFYATFTIEGLREFRLIFEYRGAEQYRAVETLAGNARAWSRHKNEASEKTESEAISSSVQPNGKNDLVELWRGKDEIMIVLNGHKLLAWQTPAPPVKGMIAVDVNAGATVKKARVETMEPIRLSCSHYAEFGQHPFTITDGKWEVKGGAFVAMTDSATALTGAPWWRDVQMSAMAKLPKTGGRVDFGLRYRDANNCYLLRLEKIRQSLVRTQDGTETILANSARNLDAEDFRRVTLRQYGDNLGAYWDGQLLLQAQDDAIPCGQAMMAVHGAGSNWRDNLQIDDLDFASADPEPMSKRNETLPVCHTRYGIRTINSVLDADGPTGGFQPGILRGEAKDQSLSRHFEALSSPWAKIPAYRTLDFQWLECGRVEAVRGYGIRNTPGFFRLDAPLTASAAWLWSLRAVWGDFQVSGNVRGKSHSYGLELRDFCAVPGSPAVSEVRIYPKEGIWRINAGGKSCAQGSLPQTEQAETAWNHIKVECRTGILRWSWDGQALAEHPAPPTDHPLRLGWWANGGKIELDNLEGLLFPDLAYDFQINHAWRMTLSDWEFPFGLTNLRHRGGYHSCLEIAPRPGGEAAIRSRRTFVGDLMALAMPRVESGGSFTVRLRKPEGAKVLWEATCRENELRVSSMNEPVPLHLFGERSFQYPHVLIRKSAGTITLFIEDAVGSYRQAAVSPLADDNSPVQIEFSGTPTLALHQVLVWGKEPSP